MEPDDSVSLADQSESTEPDVESLKRALDDEINAHNFTKLLLEDESRNVQLGVEFIRSLQQNADVKSVRRVSLPLPTAI